MNLFECNRQKLLEDMNSGDVAVFFAGLAPASTADSLYPFRIDKNFYYMTGLKREGFILAMEKNNQENKTILFIAEPNYDIEKWIGRALSKEFCSDRSGISDIRYISEFDKYFHGLVESAKIQRVLLDLTRVFNDREGLYAHTYAKKLKEAYPQLSVASSHGYMRQYRMVKAQEEVEQIRKAVALTGEGLEAVMSAMKPGIAEKSLEAVFDYTITVNGADRSAFETIAASGDNALILHYIENDDIAEDGELVLLDLGAQYGEYSADITRTYPVNGKFTERQKSIYNLVMKAHDGVVDMIKPGLDFKELNNRCKEILTEGLMELGLIDEAEGLTKYYYHGVSHFLGLDTHDVGHRDRSLEAGMVLTVEPGLYIAEDNIGIRIEDNVLVTDSGCEVLSKDIIRDVEAIEAFMSKEG